MTGSEIQAVQVPGKVFALHYPLASVPASGACGILFHFNIIFNIGHSG